MYLLKQLLFLWLRNFTFYHALWHILGSGWHSASYREGKLLGRKFANFAVARVPGNLQNLAGDWTGEVQNIPQFLFRINKYDCRSQELEMPVGTEGGRCSAENRMDRRKLLTRSILIQFASQRTAGPEITKYPDEGQQYPLRSTWALWDVWDVIQCGPAEDKWLHGLIGCCKNSLDRFATGYLRCVQKEQLARGVLVLEVSKKEEDAQQQRHNMSI